MVPKIKIKIKIQYLQVPATVAATTTVIIAAWNRFTEFVVVVRLVVGIVAVATVGIIGGKDNQLTG